MIDSIHEGPSYYAVLIVKKKKQKQKLSVLLSFFFFIYKRFKFIWLIENSTLGQHDNLFSWPYTNIEIRRRIYLKKKPFEVQILTWIV